MQYTWVGVAYLLTQTALQPLYGRVSDLIGRKAVLHASILVFAVGSLLCGAAQSAKWLIGARALAGMGAGGIVSAVWVITSEIVEEQHRAKWSQALSITWGASAVAGPLLGGVFSGHQGKGIVSWRWGFYINLPICAVAVVIITLTLRNIRLARDSDASFRRFLGRFDFGGLILFVGGSGCIVVGFGLASDTGWSSPPTLVGIILGAILLVAAGIWECYTKRECLFPPTMFRKPTAVFVLVISFLHYFAFTSGTFYLALFYQAANGSTPLQAGIKMLPYSLGASMASMPAAWFMTAWQQRTGNTSGQKAIISTGLFVCTVGFGLLNLLHENSSLASQVLYPLVAGIGIGMLFHSPYQVFCKAITPAELATGTSAFFLTRFTGTTIGLAASGAIFSARSRGRLPTGLPLNGSGHSIHYSALIHLQPEELKRQVLMIVASSIRTIWTVCTPLLGISLLMSFLLRSMPVETSATPPHTTARTTSDSTSTSHKGELTGAV
ncbi:amino acid permease ScVBA-like protein [Coprinellus micaceus]|uniref:Amino acid permease ScVBA-like protein n=1 Tax=Coprinellus micaceus TaxID=71717 RepID=A0A4Y7TZD9_COPMI|nr:amino acid permease ScVBA-like protein [Coprinellus micaceus]